MTVEIRKLTESFSVSPQISLSDIADIAALGYKTIFCNRPDQESPDQISIKDIELEAQKFSINVVFQPVVSGQIYDAQVSDFYSNFVNSDKPILACCRTGTRCSILWTLSHAGKKDFNELLLKTSAAGYELGHLCQRFSELAKN